MKKKELRKLAEELFDRLEKARITVDELKRENAQLKEQIERLRRTEEDCPESKADSSQSEYEKPIKSLEQKLINQAKLNDGTRYGATVIGKTVVTAARYCNALTASQGNESVKELVNLILGRTEVAKAEILNVVSSNADFEEKKCLIDAQQKAAEDYFEIVMAQIN